MAEIGTLTRDNLFAGSEPQNPEAITIKSGVGVVTKGTLMIALAANSGEYTVVDKAATPTVADKKTVIVLANDVDATSAAVVTTGYRSGQYDSNYMNFGSDVLADWKVDARNVNIIINTGAVNAL